MNAFFPDSVMYSLNDFIRVMAFLVLLVLLVLLVAFLLDSLVLVSLGYFHHHLHHHHRSHHLYAHSRQDSRHRFAKINWRAQPRHRRTYFSTGIAHGGVRLWFGLVAGTIRVSALSAPRSHRAVGLGSTRVHRPWHFNAGEPPRHLEGVEC